MTESYVPVIRIMAGVRTDYFESVKLGEMVAIDMLQNNKIGILQG
jgi:hypothetical protein